MTFYRHFRQEVRTYGKPSVRLKANFRKKAAGISLCCNDIEQQKVPKRSFNLICGGVNGYFHIYYCICKYFKLMILICKGCAEERLFIGDVVLETECNLSMMRH